MANVDNKVIQYINEMNELTSYQTKAFALSKLIEEVHELMHDIENKKFNEDNFIGEMADVIYCIFCYCNQFNRTDKLIEQLEFKLDRQYKRELDKLILLNSYNRKYD